MSDAHASATGLPTPREARLATGAALALVVALSLLAGRTLLAPGFYDAHDNLLNLHRLHQLERCVDDGQWPCRWAPDMAAGFGAPLFSYYPPLPSITALSFRGLGMGPLDAVKLTMWLALVGAGLSMFATARGLLGDAGAAVAAVFYVWAPYRAVDVFVRGALAETFALALLPLAFLAAHWLLTGRARLRAALACAAVWAALLQTHHGVCLMAAPIYAAWCALWIGRSAEPRRLAAFAAAHVGAFALAAWFVVPAIAERHLVHLDSLTTLYRWSRYEENFLGLAELLLGTRPWGHGPFGTPSGMSPFVGVAHWAIASVSGIAVVTAAWHGRLDGRRAGAVALMLAGAWAAVVMATPASRPIWDGVAALAYLQFPWRFLGIAALGFAFAAGAGVEIVPASRRARWGRAAVTCGLVALAVSGGWAWFRPAAMHVVPDAALFNEREVRRARHGMVDFLPRSVEIARFAPPPGGAAPVVAELARGSGDVLDAELGSGWLRVTVRADTDDAVLRLGQIDFPGWVITIDGDTASHGAGNDPMGRIHVALPRGLHRVEARFDETPLRRVANGVSIVSVLGFVMLGVAARRPPPADPRPSRPPGSSERPGVVPDGPR